MSEVFVARQPILDARQKVFAYELLYRSSLENFYSSIDGTQASASIIDNAFFVIGLESLTRGKRAFINFTENLLADDIATYLPKKSVVIEILEDIEPTREIIEKCHQLKAMGCMLALDDFVYTDKFLPLIELVDIIKVDFLDTDWEEREAIIKRIDRENIRFLAEKVETKEEFERALEIGYSYFQGYFFSKPVIISGKDIPSTQQTQFQLLQEINKEEMDFDRVELLIKADLALTYKLLRFINSIHFSFVSEIHEIKQILSMLGQKNIKKWLSFIILKNIATDKSDELAVSAVCRGRFCELLAPKVGLNYREADLFLLGMFSLIDAFLDQPLAVVLEELPISQEIKDALLGKRNKFRNVYELVIAYERGKWEVFSAQAELLKVAKKDVRDLYFKSLQLSSQALL